MYFLIFFTIRLMGKRQVGDMQPFELVVTLLIAQVASEPVLSVDVPLLHGILPVVILFLIQSAVSFFALKSRGFKRIVVGKPAIIMEDGKIDYKALKKNRIDIADVMELTRNDGQIDLSGVNHFIIETNGKPSIITDNKPLPDILVSDGEFLKDVTGRRSKETLQNFTDEMNKQQIKTLKNILLAYEFDSQIHFYLKE